MAVKRDAVSVRIHKEGIKVRHVSGIASQGKQVRSVGVRLARSLHAIGGCAAWDAWTGHAEQPKRASSRWYSVLCIVSLITKSHACQDPSLVGLQARPSPFTCCLHYLYPCLGRYLCYYYVRGTCLS